MRKSKTENYYNAHYGSWSKAWKSPGILFLNKCTNPVLEINQFKTPALLKKVKYPADKNL